MVLYAMPTSLHSRKPEGHLMLKGLTAFDLMETKHNIVLWCATNDVPVSGHDDHSLFTHFMKFVPPNKPFSGSLLRIWEEVKQWSDTDPSLNPMVMLWREIGRHHSAELRAVTHEDVCRYLALRPGELLQDALQRLRNLLNIQNEKFRVTWQDAHRWFAEGIADTELRISLGRRYHEKCNARDPQTAEGMMSALEQAVQAGVGVGPVEAAAITAPRAGRLAAALAVTVAVTSSSRDRGKPS
ncbi:hypothetical protein GPECTOR_49g517 [Gonium pectorale]|uniref:Uncharacterized protein n=1 Tax=Gonium pectorale TaxID=33097 RepID=A0A150G822_GONPE|nr:hypothetical protein GPECTOR_49g517 [Gonium pectorale]|eukprot:KXZ45933.1 hypothetical protein GPECTOR_49g517 [Gonium pectorale]